MPVGSLDDVVRVVTVEVAVLISHLWFKPEAKHHAQLVDSLGQATDAVGEAVAIGPPVTEPGRFLGPFAEPTIVEDEEFDAEVVGLFG